MCLVWEVNVIFTPIHLHIVHAELLLCVDPLEQREDSKHIHVHMNMCYIFIIHIFAQSSCFYWKDFSSTTRRHGFLYILQQTKKVHALRNETDKTILQNSKDKCISILSINEFCVGWSQGFKPDLAQT